jgi:hypothetical protein
MKNSTLQKLSLITALVLMASCGAPQPNIKPDPKGSLTEVDTNQDKGAATTRGDTIKNIKAGKDLEFPYKYDQETSFKDLTMLVAFNKVEAKVTKGGKVYADNGAVGTVSQQLSTYLQAQMGKSKRFDVYCAFGDGAIALAKELGDLGEADTSNIEEVELPKFDVFCDCELMLWRREFERNDGTDRVTYKADILFSIKDINKRMIGEPVRFTGETKELKIIKNLAGERIGGVDLEAETLAIRNAAMVALTKVYREVGHQFPVSGRVTGISQIDNDRMTMDRGTKHGLQKGQQLVIWYKNEDSGDELPLAYAEANPGEKRGSILVLGWTPKIKEPGYKALVGQILSPGWLKQNKDMLFFTSEGMALPPEWRR